MALDTAIGTVTSAAADVVIDGTVGRDHTHAGSVGHGVSHEVTVRQGMSEGERVGSGCPIQLVAHVTHLQGVNQKLDFAGGWQPCGKLGFRTGPNPNPAWTKGAVCN